MRTHDKSDDKKDGGLEQAFGRSREDKTTLRGLSSFSTFLGNVERYTLHLYDLN